MANEIQLLNWQSEVVYGNQPSLAVPAPVRSGKNIAVVFAAKQRKTLVIDLAEKILTKELNYYGVDNFKVITTSKFLDDLRNGNLFFDVGRFEQVIINEHLGKVTVVDILRIRDNFEGRIVVIGTPTDVPDPVFYPLSKIPEWHLLNVDYMQMKHVEALKSILKYRPYTTYATMLKQGTVEGFFYHDINSPQ